MSESLDINGEVPNLADQILEELLCTAMWHKGKLEEPVNVVYLKINGSWLRHYFDCGIIFWREHNEAPIPYEMPELSTSFKVVNLASMFGFKGLKIKSFDAYTVEGGSESVFKFYDGKSIAFSNVNDLTVFRT